MNCYIFRTKPERSYINVRGLSGMVRYSALPGRMDQGFAAFVSQYAQRYSFFARSVRQKT